MGKEKTGLDVLIFMGFILSQIYAFSVHGEKELNIIFRVTGLVNNHSSMSVSQCLTQYLLSILPPSLVNTFQCISASG